MVPRVKYKEIIFAIIFTLILFKFLLYSGSKSSTPNKKSSDLIVQITQRNTTEDLGESPLEQDLFSGRDAIPLSPVENDLLYRVPIDIALIFTKGVDNTVLQYNLRRAVGSLLKNAHVPIRLHLISDEESFSVGLSIIKEIQEASHLDSRHIKLVFVSASELEDEVRPVFKILQQYFTNESSSQYKDFLFFFSLFLDHLLTGIHNIILMDIDIQVEGDIAELYSHFSRFSETQIIGLSPELSPVYRHILSTYRSTHPNTSHGSPLISGGFPGYNSGVMLINIPRLRDSSVIKQYLTRPILEKTTKKYNFEGQHGDQDLYTLIALDYPELFYSLPCSWNRQLCKYWNIKLYKDIFDQYFKCPGKVKIVHGNCKTPIPP